MDSLISTIIVGANTKKQKEAAYELCEKKGIDPLDITLLDFLNVAKLEKRTSIGIKDIRDIYLSLFLKPIKGKLKAYILHGCDLLTQEAQQALLKTLEEPPMHTFLVLTVVQKDSLLPTILSRCHVVKLLTALEKTDEDTLTAEELQKIEKSCLGEKLFLAQQHARTKEDAKQYLIALLHIVRKAIIQKQDRKMHQLLSKTHNTYVIVDSTNANHRLSLEILLLSL